MKFTRVLSILMAIIIVVGSISFAASAVEKDLAPSEYYNQTMYETEANAAVNSGVKLGCTYTPSKTTFAVWSPPASSVMVKLYATGTDNESGASTIGTYPLTKNQSTCIWSTSLTGDYKNTYYTYILVINGVTNETPDPYSKAVGANGDRSMVCDLDSTDPDGWDKDKHVVFNNPNEAVVYELHVRDFSIDKSSGVKDEYKGKFMAFTEGDTKVNGTGSTSTCLDYLTEHNINCVQLMPIADMASVDETSTAVQRNWGYDSKNYNVPEGSYSTDPYNGNTRITEFKMLVQALHDRGISVVMDVVYNHTFVLQGSSLSMTCPKYYYRMQDAENYCDGSGLGNVLASEKKMCQKYIADSLKYWAEEYHIDGFRFDLMGCIDTTSIGVFRKELDKVNNKITMWGEPWCGGSNNGITNGVTNSNLKTLDPRIGAFNQGYADSLKGNHEVTTVVAKGFVQGGNGSAEVLNAAKGVSTYLSGSKASQLVNYVDNHDNLCLYDQVLASNGQLTAGKDDKNLYTKNKDKVNNTNYNNQIRLALTSAITSQGIPFALAGDDMARSKYGDYNSYRTPDNMNAIDWNRASKFSDISEYYKGLTAIRQAYHGFSQGTAQSTSSVSSTCAVAYQLSQTRSGEWNKVIVALNNTSSAKSVTLSGSWKVLSNGSKASTVALGDASGSYSVPAYSGVILCDAASYNNYKQPVRDTMKLSVEQYTRDSKTGSYKKVSTSTATYVDGMTYRANKDLSILFDHDFDKFESTSNTTYGTAKAGTNVTVKFYYTRNIKSNYINVQFLNTSTGNQVRSPMKYRVKDGEKFAIPAAAVQNYSLDASKYPAATIGTVDANKAVTIKFYYKPLSLQTTRVHYYTTKWSAVSAYAYYSDDNGDLVEPLGPWTAPKSKVGMSKETIDGDSHWFYKDIPVAQCYFMAHPSDGSSQQDPGAGEQGYNVSGEAWVKNKAVTFNCTIVTSFIDVDTGKQLKADVVKDYVKVSSSNIYATTPDKSFTEYEIIMPANASGFYTAGTTNVVYLYQKKKVDPTIPTDPTVPTKPTDPTSPTAGDTLYLGDTDLNTKIEVSDATKIQQSLARIISLSSDQTTCADVDANKKVEILDATYLQQFLAKIPVKFDIGKPIVSPTKPTDPTQPTQYTTPTQGGEHDFTEFVEKYNDLVTEFAKYSEKSYGSEPAYVFAKDTISKYQSTTFNPFAPQSEIDAGYNDCVKAIDGLKQMKPVTIGPQEDEVYLSIEQLPDWAADGAKFAAYFYSDGGNEWISMSLFSSNVYKVDIPSGYTNVIFCRMAPGKELNWDNRWNQTEDLTIEPGGTYYITEWGADFNPVCPGYWG